MATEMEWYHGDRVTDVVVPRDPGEWIRFQSQERCKQWGVDAVDSFGSLDESSLGNNASEFSCETLMNELEMECVVGERDEEDISGVLRGISESSNCWTTLLNYQDFRLDGFPGTNQTDENFVNSLIVDDMRVSEQFQGCSSPRSQGGYERGEAQVSYSSDWEEESDLSHQSPSNVTKNDVPLHNAPVENYETPPQQADRKIRDHQSVEEITLQEFGSTLQKMTNKTRLSIRDSFYRLANSSDKDSSKVQGECALENISLISRSTETLLESRASAIDRAIIDLMLRKAYSST